MSKWDVFIVGAGVSGLAVGALLAESGKKVLLLEKENYIGGRAFTTTYKGQFIDNGAHLPMRIGYLEEIFSRIDKPYPKFGPLYKKMEIYHGGNWRELGRIINRQELRKIIQGITSSSYDDLEKYDDMSIKQWISARTDDESLHLFFWSWGWLGAVGCRFEDISAGETLVTIKQQLDMFGTLAGVSGSIVGGLSKFINPLADAIKEKGGEIRTGVKVSNIIIEDGRACGIELEKEEKIIPSQLVDVEFIEAPVIISTLPLWELFNIVSEEKFPYWYVDWIERISKKISNVWTVIYATDQPLWDELTWRWVPDLPRCQMPAILCWYPTHGKKVNQHQAQFVIQGNWSDLPSVFQTDRVKERNKIKQVLDYFEEDINELLPDLEKHTIWKVRQAAAYGIAQSSGLVGKQRPHLQPPGVDNFYLVSDTIREARGTGMQAVAKAALQCAELILNSEGK